VRKEALAKLPGEAILAQLHLGFMTMVATLTDEEKRAVASYIAGKPVARPSKCRPRRPRRDYARKPPAPRRRTC
jgi:hypothetical protein